MSQLQSLAIRKKISAFFKNGTSKQNLGIPATVELLAGAKDMPVTVSGDEPSASDLLRDLAAAANRKITCAENGLVLTLPVAEPTAPVEEPTPPVEPSQPADEAGLEERTVQTFDAQQPARPPKPHTTRGDIPAGKEPAFVRKYPTLASIFFNGSVKGQINSVFKTRIANPQKVLDYKAALANGDVTLGTQMLKKSLTAKLVEMGIDPSE
jgi:hypothetical protein